MKDTEYLELCKIHNDTIIALNRILSISKFKIDIGDIIISYGNIILVDEIIVYKENKYQRCKYSGYILKKDFTLKSQNKKAAIDYKNVIRIVKNIKTE